MYSLTGYRGLSSKRHQHCELLPGESPCDHIPCNNGGKCESEAATYRCTCLVGFEGKNCEIRMKGLVCL